MALVALVALVVLVARQRATGDDSLARMTIEPPLSLSPLRVS
ncbi:hypothetical protein [Streptomyces sp. NPDC007904]